MAETHTGIRWPAFSETASWPVCRSVGHAPGWTRAGLHHARAERFSEAASAYQQAAVSARRRGALAEAHGYLTRVLIQLDRISISGDRDRDRQEMALRLDRGVLSAAVHGQQDSRSVADFERCCQLGGTDLRDDRRRTPVRWPRCSTPAVSLGFNAYTTFFDAVLGRLLIAAGRLGEARDRLNTGLQSSADIGMSFYDAELLRLRAHTRSESEARRADVVAALDLARRQGAALFELRAALTDFDLRGAPARSWPATSSSAANVVGVKRL